MRCLKCQNENVSDARFCQTCGAPLTQNVPQPQQNQPQAVQQVMQPVQQPMPANAYMQPAGAQNVGTKPAPKKSGKPLAVIVFAVLAIANFCLIKLFEFNSLEILFSIETYSVKILFYTVGLGFGGLFTIIAAVLLLSCLCRKIFQASTVVAIIATAVAVVMLISGISTLKKQNRAYNEIKNELEYVTGHGSGKKSAKDTTATHGKSVDDVTKEIDKYFGG